MKNIVYKVQTISELHEIAGFEKPKHPLVTVIDYSKVNVHDSPESGSFICSFYSVNFKKHCDFIYGRQPFDHKEGTLHCTAPEQIITFNRKKEANSSEGWGLYFHPELIRNTALGKKIKEYSFFSYAENEALHLSEQEKIPRNIFIITYWRKQKPYWLVPIKTLMKLLTNSGLNILKASVNSLRKKLESHPRCSELHNPYDLLTVFLSDY